MKCTVACTLQKENGTDEIFAIQLRDGDVRIRRNNGIVQGPLPQNCIAEKKNVTKEDCFYLGKREVCLSIKVLVI